MLIQEMSRQECMDTLRHRRLARLACVHEGQPYIVPTYLVHDGAAADEAYLYGFSALGQKIEWMRANPLVCVELDEVTNHDQWMSIIIFGRYEELPAPADEQPILRGTAGHQSERTSRREHAWQLLQTYPMWWQPASVSRTQDTLRRTFIPIFYRILIERVTGRRTIPSTNRFPEAPPGWLRRLMRRFFFVGTGRTPSEASPLVSQSDASATDQ